MGDFDHPKLKTCDTGATIEINDDPFTIGRGLMCNFVISNSVISRVHCRLEKNLGCWSLKDTSSNGTYVNGKLLKYNDSARLRNNDVIALAPESEKYIFMDQLDDSISDEQLNLIADSVEVLQGDPPASEDWNQGTAQPATESATMFGSRAQFANYNVSARVSLPVFGSVSIPIDPTTVTERVSTRGAAVDGGDVPSLKKSRLDLVETHMPNVLNSSKDRGNSAGKAKPCQNQIKTSDKVTKEAESINLINAGTSHLDMGEIENELQCSICSELFVKATTLNCSHSFCRYCIVTWKSNKSVCPICRAPITDLSPSLVLDNVIEKVMQNSTEDEKQLRKQLMEDRIKMSEQAEGPVPPPGRRQDRNRNRGNGRGRGNSNNANGNLRSAVANFWTNAVPVTTGRGNTIYTRRRGNRNNNRARGASGTNVADDRGREFTGTFPIDSMTTNDPGPSRSNATSASVRSGTNRNNHRSNNRNAQGAYWRELYDVIVSYEDQDSAEENIIFGGYGCCYSCGRRGHYMADCPLN